MPTELPDLSSELARRYNEQQRELHALRQQFLSVQGSPTDPVELERLKSELRELNQQLDAARRQCAEQKDAFDADARRLGEELAATRRAELAALELVSRLETQLHESQAKFETAARKHNNDLGGLQKRFDETTARLNAEIFRLTHEVPPTGAVGPPPREPRPQPNEPPKPGGRNGSAPHGSELIPVLSGVELARKLKDLRKKVTEYSARLTNLRGFESSISSRLEPEQLQDLVEALSKELNGMMQRYQALSLWEKTEAREGT
jgi:DNA repair exonuclease SbcCD ATPase subunit